MAFSEFEIKRREKAIEKFMAKHRPPAHIRNKLDFGSRIENQSVEIFEIRPQWNNPSNKMEAAVAKALYVKTQNHWKIFWQRSDLKWHSYEPLPTVTRLEDFLKAVGEDQYHCFFG
jgi:hypothetical protein